MTLLDRLFSAHGERDNAANIALAEEIVHTHNTAAIRELADRLHDKSTRLASDCIKTLYEIGEHEPKLIADYVDEFAALLTNKTPRLVWSAMCALDAAASVNPDGVYAHLNAILKTADGESVIARDHAVHILRKLCAAGHAKKCFPKMLDIIRTAPTNQWPTYAEQAATVAPQSGLLPLAAIIEERLPDIMLHKSKTMRMQKVLRQLSVT